MNRARIKAALWRFGNSTWGGLLIALAILALGYGMDHLAEGSTSCWQWMCNSSSEAPHAADHHAQR